MDRRGALLLVVALLVLRAAPGQAHAVGVSRGEYRADGDEVRAVLVFARPELLAALPGLEAERAATRPSAALAAWIGRGLVIRVPAGACLGHLVAASVTEGDGIEVTAVYRCPAAATSFSLRLDLLGELSLGHRHLLTASRAATSVRSVLYEAEPEVAFAPVSRHADAPRGVGAAMLRLGVAHILGGYDHLLFLLAVVLVGGSLRAILGVVTAFTLAHSVTLAVAASGLWTPRPTLVEPAIALSIAYVGIENCVAPDLRRRWRLTFLFGLVHGFGFAGALREVALSAAELPLALAAFNVGVEAGQLVVLALVLPLVSWLGARAWFARGGFQAANVAIAAAGLWWFVERVRG